MVGGGVLGSANEYSCAHGAQISFGDLNSIFNLGPLHYKFVHSQYQIRNSILGIHNVPQK